MSSPLYCHECGCYTWPSVFREIFLASHFRRHFNRVLSCLLLHISALWEALCISYFFFGFPIWEAMRCFHSMFAALHVGMVLFPCRVCEMVAHFPIMQV